jgi:hypothetical protein
MVVVEKIHEFSLRGQRKTATENGNGQRQRTTATDNGNGQRQRKTATDNGNGQRQRKTGNGNGQRQRATATNNQFAYPSPAFCSSRLISCCVFRASARAFSAKSSPLLAKRMAREELTNKPHWLLKP